MTRTARADRGEHGGPRVTHGFRRVLVANRGEIAARVIRTCARLGIETVLAASDADLDSVPARLADKVIRIGPAPASASYLSVEAITGAAVTARADAVHPGYGFLSENARLARALAQPGSRSSAPRRGRWTSPGTSSPRGSRPSRRGCPCCPGSTSYRRTWPAPPPRRRLARRVGLPALVKAAGGGGGRGLRVVRDPAAAQPGGGGGQRGGGRRRSATRGCTWSGTSPPPGTWRCRSWATASGSSTSGTGTARCSGATRSSSRRRPRPACREALRARLHRAAVTLGEHLRYRGAGTVEFLLDVTRGEFYFLEVNARIQVEHPVTEAVTGHDIVVEQIWIAEGRPLRLAQDDVRLSGHAIECRLNAEDPRRGFLPSPGTVTAATFPAGPASAWTRTSRPGSAVPPHYDSLLAKVITHGASREQALDRLRAALGPLRRSPGWRRTSHCSRR